jgi:replicative DNA helicase
VDEQLRALPHDLIAEQSVLGGMMLSKQALWDVAGLLEAGDYYQPKHEEIHVAIIALMQRDEPVDAITVGDELARTGRLNAVGGAPYLHELTGIVPTAANAGFYAEIVREKAIRRRLVEAGTRIAQMGYSTVGVASEQAETARAALDAAASNSSSDIEAIGRALPVVVEELNAQPKVVETPWREVNELIGGLRPGGLYVVGARPGEGKTIVGMQIAQNLARLGPVAFSSLEMSQSQLLERLIALRAKVHMGRMARHDLTPEDWQSLARVRGDIERMPLYVDDRSGVTITQIKAFARSVKRRGEMAGVVVDYLQLITGGDRSKPRHEVVGEISRQLKIMARELECPVVALSQLNRESAATGKGKRAPTAADLRESGSIEQDADVVMLLQRQQVNDVPIDRLDVIVAKNRHGETGKRVLLWEGQYARVTSQRWSPTGGLDIPA